MCVIFNKYVSEHITKVGIETRQQMQNYSKQFAYIPGILSIPSWLGKFTCGWNLLTTRSCRVNHGEPPLRSQIGKSLNVAFNIFQNPDNLKSGFYYFPIPSPKIVRFLRLFLDVCPL